jgi:hypothetical protein
MSTDDELRGHVEHLLDRLANNPVRLPEETVHVEQWKCSVTLRGFTSRERDAFEEGALRRANAKAGNGATKRGTQQSVNADLTNFRARLVAAHIVENGMRTMANPKGEEALGDQPSAVLDKLFAVAQRLSGFTGEDVEALVGNSSATADGSASSSPEPSDAPSLS